MQDGWTRYPLIAQAGQQVDLGPQSEKVRSVSSFLYNLRTIGSALVHYLQFRTFRGLPLKSVMRDGYGDQALGSPSPPRGNTSRLGWAPLGSSDETSEVIFSLQI